MTQATPEQFELRSQSMGALPLLGFFLARMGLAEHLQSYLPRDDARLRLAPAAVIGLLVRSIVVARRPLYALAEWAALCDQALLGLEPGDEAALNDDRVGRTLDRLFDADRASLITGCVLAVVREFGVSLAQLHNDSTSVTLSGSYAGADGRPRGGKATPAIRHGHNKDFRPDLKQLLFILTATADGAVPIACRVADGNTPDEVTHVPTWDELRALVGHADFLFRGGRQALLERGHGPHRRPRWALRHRPSLAGAARTPGSATGRRATLPPGGWRFGVPARASVITSESGAPSRPRRPRSMATGWSHVHSSGKAARDAAARAARIEAGLAALDLLAARLAGPKTRLKTRVSAEEAAAVALTAAGATRWVGFTITEAKEVAFRQERRGHPGSETRYRRSEKPVFTVSAAIHAEAVAYDAATDGCFPLITNDVAMSPAEVLAAYRYQPHLERRHHMLKGPQEVAPVYLQTPQRIEALLLCHFLAMLAEALIEREIRTSMKSAGLPGIPLYPELRSCPCPSAPRILEIFRDVQRHELVSEGEVVQSFEPHLTPLQQQVLELLHVPASVYAGANAV